MATVVLDRSWWSFAGPHGGLVGSLLLNAARSLTDHPPRSLHVQFPAPAPEGPVEIETTLVRQGRSAAFVLAAMRSGDTTIARASLACGPARPGPAIGSAPPPTVEPPEQVDEVVVPTELLPMGQHFEYRPVQGPFAMDGGPAELFGWVRFRDGRPIDEAAATVLVDALPPALYRSVPLPVPIPTADLSVQFTGTGSADGWSLGRITTRHAGDGWCVDDSEVWAVDGRLLATARQTRLVLGAAA